MIHSTSLGLLLAACTAVAQTGGGPPSFEVASVKPSAPITSKEGKERVGRTASGSRMEINFTSLAELVRIAYRVKPYQVLGPEWTASEHFDVLARMPEGASQDQMPEMLQTLLAERFKLTLRRENKEHAVYALLVGKNGLKLQEAEPGPDPPAPSGAKAGGAIHIARKMTMAAFADFLARFVDRPVVDMTETKGTYQIAMDIPIEDLIKAKGAIENGPADAKRPAADTASDPDGSPMFAAIARFGLKLEPRKEPMEVLVIDHADRIPTAN
ncbi:MAG: TIGR03435 family protein [Bryobacteraceae bacterium]|jgi:uncharacterized protein (TIGR03435 family)